MKIKLFLCVIFFACMSFAPNLTKSIKPLKNISFNKIEYLYNTLDANNFQLPRLDSFSVAIEGLYILKEKGIIQKNFLTIIDFSLSSKTKRLWVIDMNQNKIIFNSLVSHGKKSGDDFASSFSNVNDSNKSCLGFFSTAESYVGQHGLSLKLDGLQKGINDNARKRSIVIHGADYVSPNFIKNHNRLGKSQGCPALPIEMSTKIIEKIKNKSCLFIYYPSKNNCNFN